MGLFSKIFGATEDAPPSAEGAAPSADGADGTARPPAAARDERAPSGAAEARHAEAARAQPRPSVPPSVEARLFATGAEAFAPTLRHPPAGAAAPPSKAAAPSPGIGPSRAPPVPRAAERAKPPEPVPPARPAGKLSPSRMQAIGGPAPERKSPAAKPAGAPVSRRDPALTKTITNAAHVAARPEERPRAAPAQPPGVAQAAEAARGDVPGALELEPLGPSIAPPVAVEAAPRGSLHGADDVEHAFEHLAAGAVPPGTKGMAVALADDPVARAENQRLFEQMAVGHAEPVREFLLELLVGPTTKQWLALVTPSIDTLKKGSEALELAELAAVLADFARALDHAATTAGPKITDPERETLTKEYVRLTAALPAAFELGKQRERRESLVVHHLLQQIPGLHKVAIDKLYAAGLGSLDALCRSTVADLVGLARLDADTARAVFERFQAYWRERSEAPLQKAEERTKAKLRGILDALRRAHSRFQSAEASEDRGEKRLARNERRARCLEVNVLLAQLGEVDLVEDLERSPTELKIERVERYIQQESAASRPRMESFP